MGWCGGQTVCLGFVYRRLVLVGVTGPPFKWSGLICEGFVYV